MLHNRKKWNQIQLQHRLCIDDSSTTALVLDNVQIIALLRVRDHLRWNFLGNVFFAIVKVEN